MNTHYIKLLYKISKAYYEEELTQQEIGAKYGLSRIKVSRLLQRARDEGFIKITLNFPDIGKDNVDLEQQLEKKYSLKEVVVTTPAGRTIEGLLQSLGETGADYVSENITGEETIAISWGYSLLSVVNALSRVNYPRMTIVQMIGGLGNPEAEAHGSDLTRRLADKFGCKARLIQAPGIVADTVVYEGLRNDPYIHDTLEKAAGADIALVGIGCLSPECTVVRDKTILTNDDFERLRKKNAAGDIALRYFGDDGTLVHDEIDERIIGVTLKQIKKIQKVIGIAGGPSKRTVIKGALRGGYIDVLITDEETAKALLEGPS